MKNTLYIKSTPSTNDFLKDFIRDNKVPEGFTVYTDFQTKGKGQPGNKWNAEKNQNLLFSIIVFPYDISIDKQFVISQIISFSIVKTLEKYIDNVKIKWPNDIYWNDKKLGGILIENSLQGNAIKHSIIGVGLNVNQITFPVEIPNPISMKQIIGKSFDRKRILAEIIENFSELFNDRNKFNIKEKYLNSLFRKDEFYQYKTIDGELFSAKVADIESDGKLILQTPKNEKKEFYFKEIEFIF